jgi:hypothetical protein
VHLATHFIESNPSNEIESNPSNEIESNPSNEIESNPSNAKEAAEEEQHKITQLPEKITAKFAQHGEPYKAPTVPHTADPAHRHSQAR